MAIYDLLAPHYDAVTGDSSTETAFVDKVISHSGHQAITLLEVACGTGSIIAPLAHKYQVSGLDISPGMLDIARAKLPAGTPLHLADMSDFELSVKFDVIICVYHGINHLLRFESWGKFFDCAYRHLADDGVLIFDVLSIENLKAMASIPEIEQKYGDRYLVIKVRAGNEAVFDWNVEVFEGSRDRGCAILSEVIRTASFARDSIEKALGERFSSIRIIGSDGSVIDHGSDNRTWFLCTRRQSQDSASAGRAAGRPAPRRSAAGPAGSLR